MNKVKSVISIFAIFFLGFCLAEESENINRPNTWEKSQHGVTVSLKQLHPDQVDAFYIGRGFTMDQIKPYTKTCVYTVVMRNDKALSRIHFIRSYWKAKNKENEQAIKKSSEWLSLFKVKKVTPSALIAFRLAQFPEEQEYEPNGDWNQGMLSINMPAGSTFDLMVYWDMKGIPYKLKLKEVHCAK